MPAETKPNRYLKSGRSRKRRFPHGWLPCTRCGGKGVLKWTYISASCPDCSGSGAVDPPPVE